MLERPLHGRLLKNTGLKSPINKSPRIKIMFRRNYGNETECFELNTKFQVFVQSVTFQSLRPVFGTDMLTQLTYVGSP
jgi:hypothetical protein